MVREKMNILFFILKKKLLKNGEAPVLVRITIDGKNDEARVLRSIPPHLWNQAKGCSKGKDRASIELNEYIESLRLKLFTLHNELLNRKAVITPNLLLMKLFEQEEKHTLIASFEKHIEECRSLIGIDYEAVTINRYDNCLRSLKKVVKKEFDKDDITFYEMDGEFVRKYELYLKTHKGLCQNTIVRYMKCFKKITNIALQRGWMDKDPFIGIKYAQIQTDPTFLTKEELDKIVRKEFALERLELVRDIFVFCCFTFVAFMNI